MELMPPAHQSVFTREQYSTYSASLDDTLPWPGNNNEHSEKNILAELIVCLLPRKNPGRPLLNNL